MLAPQEPRAEPHDPDDDEDEPESLEKLEGDVNTDEQKHDGEQGAKRFAFEIHRATLAPEPVLFEKLSGALDGANVYQVEGAPA